MGQAQKRPNTSKFSGIMEYPFKMYTYSLIKGIGLVVGLSICYCGASSKVRVSGWSCCFWHL